MNLHHQLSIAEVSQFWQHGSRMRARWPDMNDIRKGGTDITPEWRAEFDAAAARPLDLRLKYAFIHTYKPVLDDAPYRSFETMQEYREWCNNHLPSWLGYGSD